jgi:hypothetical protein
MLWEYVSYSPRRISKHGATLATARHRPYCPCKPVLISSRHAQLLQGQHANQTPPFMHRDPHNQPGPPCLQNSPSDQPEALAMACHCCPLSTALLPTMWPSLSSSTCTVGMGCRPAAMLTGLQTAQSGQPYTEHVGLGDKHCNCASRLGDEPQQLHLVQVMA